VHRPSRPEPPRKGIYTRRDGRGRRGVRLRPKVLIHCVARGLLVWPGAGGITTAAGGSRGSGGAVAITRRGVVRLAGGPAVTMATRGTEQPPPRSTTRCVFCGWAGGRDCSADARTRHMNIIKTKINDKRRALATRPSLTVYMSLINRLAIRILCPKKTNPLCEYCRYQLSVKHITLERPKFNDLRSILGNPTSMEQALGEKNTHNVFKYFKLTRDGKTIVIVYIIYCVICLKRMQANDLCS